MMVRKKQHDHGGHHTRRDQLFRGIGAQGAHGIDLLGHGHRAQFAGHAGRVAAGHHEPGDDRSQFRDHADRYQLGDKSERPEPR